jgi:tetratricopeptide (TPR) repeat protein
MVDAEKRAVRKIVLIMIAVVAAGIIIAWLYYRSVNKSTDPRIIEAREMYGRYDGYARSGDYRLIFALLDSLENVYLATVHYADAFETGVVLNNKAAALITLVLGEGKIPPEMNPFSSLSNDSIMTLARSYSKQAESLYLKWQQRFGTLTTEEIREAVSEQFLTDLYADSEKATGRYLASRIKEIERSVAETDRRLSVCYTNQGIIERHFEDYEEAAQLYQKALDLWDRNLSAENNLNLLLGRPLVKRNIIQKLFPPPRDEKRSDK